MVYSVALGGNAPVNISGRLNEDALRDLMVRYQQADRQAVEELAERLSPMLFRFLSGPNLTRTDTEDLLQECWLRLHRARHTYRPSEPLLPWVFAIARHTRLDWFRRRKRVGSREVLVAEPPETSRPKEPSSGILEMLNRLPESQRDVLLMLKVSGMSLEEVARATSSTVGGIKQKAHRAYQALRRMLEEK